MQLNKKQSKKFIKAMIKKENSPITKKEKDLAKAVREMDRLICENIFIEEDKDFERRNHDCDGCRKSVPTERFDGYRGGHLWICSNCYRSLVRFGLKQEQKTK